MYDLHPYLLGRVDSRGEERHQFVDLLVLIHPLEEVLGLLLDHEGGGLVIVTKATPSRAGQGV